MPKTCVSCYAMPGAPGALPSTSDLPEVDSYAPTSAAAGDTVTVTGSGFTGITGVGIGPGVAADFSVVDDVTMTFVVPGRPAGVVDVLLYSPAGIVTDVDGFEVTAASVLDPATLDLTGWVRASYSGAPWAGVASAGVSGSRSFAAGTAPSAGTAVNGLTPANFVEASSHRLLDGTNADNTYLSASAYRVVMLVKLTSAMSGPVAPIFNAQGLLTGDGGYWGLVYDDTGIHCYHYDGGYQVASSAAPVATGAWALVDVQCAAGTLTVSVNGVAGTPAAVGSLGAITSYLRMGANYADAVFADAQILECLISDTDLSAVSPADFVDYVNDRYGLSL